ncbi:MAG: hypothetical protein GC192_22425 [Bacteroidetes bacterium]|nr:hypothetical protein [Bacteroidota bacterium]
MSLDLEQIKNHYAKMNDAKLENIAKFEMALLEPAVQPIVIAEIKRRGMDENLLAGIAAQTKTLSDEEVEELKDKLKGLACPSCGKPDQGLVGGIIRKVRSIVLFTQYEQRPIIACPACVEAERKSQLIKNSLFGWWGFPSGLLYRTPQAIINHFRDNGKRDAISEGILTHFAVENVGELKTNWNQEDKIVSFVRRKNSTQA